MPQVRLISHTVYPTETVYCLQKIARTNEEIESPFVLFQKRQSDDKLNKEIDRVFQDTIMDAIPVAEQIQVVFFLDGVSVALRDHIVRHRIGSKVGDHVTVENVPFLQDSSFWTQSTRCTDAGYFHRDGNYTVPESVKQDEKRGSVFHNAMMDAQNAYRTLVSIGVPLEDARDVLPLARTHRMSWALNLSSLAHILGRRSCWVSQISMWESVLKGMAEELAEYIHPCLAYLFDPPCYRKGEYKACQFVSDNNLRVTGQDPLHPCPIYMKHEVEEIATWRPTAQQAEWERKMGPRYRALWRFEV